MATTLQPVKVATGHEEEGMLVFCDGRLVAVLVHLADTNEVAPGQWFLEAGFDKVADRHAEPFPDLPAAVEWIAGRMSRDL